MSKEEIDQQEEIKQKEREENLNIVKNTKNKNIVTALRHSVDGVIRAFKTERNLRIDYFCAVCVLIAGVALGLNRTEFVCLCLTVGFVIFSEMMNSVSEYIVDLVTDKYDDRAKAAKDIAAGGVLVSSSISLIVAYFLFSDKLKVATTVIIENAISSTANIFLTIVFILVVLVVILKGFFGKNNEYSSAWPSIRVVLAFGLTTFMCIITRSFLVGLVCLILSLMILGMKINNSKAQKITVIYSAILGIIIVLLVYSLVLVGPDILKLFDF